jgi:hypothetical protein
MMCTICNENPANPTYEGSFGRPVCGDCFIEAQVTMEDQLTDLDDEIFNGDAE